MADESSAPKVARNEDLDRSKSSLIMGASTADNSAQDLPLNSNLVSRERDHPSSNSAPHPLVEEKHNNDTRATTQDDETAPNALPIIEGITNDNETRSIIQDKLHDMHYDLLAKAVFKAEKDKLVIRARQAMFHVEMTEMRIANMEQEIKQLRKDVDNLPDDFEKPKPRQPAYLREIRRIDSAAFQFTAATAAMSFGKRPVIEILQAKRTSINLSKESSEEAPISEGELPARQGNPGPVVERIRIRSRPLLESLEKATSSRILDREDDDDFRAVIFLRPFKLFVTFEKEIRCLFETLKAEAIEHNDNLDAQDLGQKTRNATEQASNDRLLLKDIELLIEVFDTDLRSNFNPREGIRNGTIEKIEYGDLWHLFEYGDNVIASSNLSQIYKAVGFTVCSH